MDKCLILSNAFSECIDMITLFFFLLYLVNIMGYINWFLNSEPLLHNWDKSHIVMVYSSFLHCQIWFTNILLKSFACVFMRDIGL